VELCIYGREDPIIQPDFTLFPVTANYVQARRESRVKGIDDLLIHSESGDDTGVLMDMKSFSVYGLIDWRHRGVEYLSDTYRRKKYIGYPGCYVMDGLPFGSAHYVHPQQVVSRFRDKRVYREYPHSCLLVSCPYLPLNMGSLFSKREFMPS
jgi:hypothetical protein